MTLTRDEELHAAIDAYIYIMRIRRYKSVPAKFLFPEVVKRVDGIPKHWDANDIADILNTYRAKSREGYRKSINLTPANEQAIIAAANEIASHEEEPRITTYKIRRYFENLPPEKKPPGVTNIIRAKSRDVHAILRKAGYTQSMERGHIISIPPARIQRIGRSGNMETGGRQP